MSKKIPKIPNGYVILARKMLESDLMNKPPLLFKLFAWMLLEARHKDQTIGKLKRGQLFTTTAEMQETMSHKIGYRKLTPTRDQIRKSYESLTKAAMITTAKTTRGMIITICNYDYYQDPKNYEAHAEAHTESARRPKGAHTINKNVERMKRKGEGNGLHPLANGFKVTAELQRWADKNGFDFIDLDLEVGKFIDHYTGNGEDRKDWNAVFRNWIRKVPEFCRLPAVPAAKDDLEFFKAERKPKK